ncbi:putative Polysaccharide deacetylase [Rhodospirillaceae bacterium LM-1]|nr:putative Polysaccharide deacetylase [Rhodospirillaceae bacterium LM-1]
MTQPVRSFAQFSAHEDAKTRLRSLARDLAIRALLLTKRPGRAAGGIRFPFWHHVFDDERADFERQLRWMKRHGDFIGFDQAVALLASGDKIDGRYFCLSFDDGFKNVLSNGAPILDAVGAKAMVYLATGYVGESDPAKLKGFYDHGQLLIEFMDWSDAKAWLAAGHEVGSHTRKHACLAALEAGGVRAELAASKADIEANLGIDCRHFCAPFGVAGTHFDRLRDPRLARDAGYESFATGHRGRMGQSGDPFFLLRDHLLAKAGDHQLRYFLGD